MDRLETVLPTPALILGRDRHLLAWNVTAHALHAPHVDAAAPEDPERRPWWPELLFCDGRVADLFVDWASKARDTVSDLRVELGRRPGDDRLAALVAGLRSGNAEFARMWGEHLIQPCAHHDRTYRHAELGQLELHDEFLELGDDDGQRLALFGAAPGTSSAAALDQLAASLTAASEPGLASSRAPRADPSG